MEITTCSVLDEGDDAECEYDHEPLPARQRTERRVLLPLFKETRKLHCDVLMQADMV